MDRGRTAMIGVVLGTAAMILGATGCTSNSSTPSDATARPAVSVPGLPPGVQQDQNVPADVPNNSTDRPKVQVAKCEAVAGGWSASGTAKNTDSAPKDYVITIFFTTDHGTVIGHGSTTVKVPAGGQNNWSVVTKLTPVPNALCVLRGVS